MKRCIRFAHVLYAMAVYESQTHWGSAMSGFMSTYRRVS